MTFCEPFLHSSIYSYLFMAKTKASILFDHRFCCCVGIKKKIWKIFCDKNEPASADFDCFCAPRDLGAEYILVGGGQRRSGG